MANGPFTPGIGRIAADLYDFRKHVAGEDFRHNATQIDNSPGVGGASTVQGSIDNINAFIASLSDQGTAFVAIPDGYNCYTNPATNFYFDPSIPALSDFLVPLFSAISSGTAMPQGYSKLYKGGILYIPAGTYYITETVEIPPSVILLGEGFATQIINATSLDLSVSPPVVDGAGTPAPVFYAKADTARGNNDDIIDSDNVNGSFMFGRAIKIFNLLIADNFVEPTSLGDLNYKLAQNTSGETPLVMQGQGSNLELQNVYFIGRASTSGTAVDFASTYAVALDTAVTSIGSILKMQSCFVDGFSIPVAYQNSAGVADYLEVSDCKMKAYGYLNGDATGAGSNCVLLFNNCNVKATNNNFFGIHDNLLQIGYLNDISGSSIPAQAYAKIMIAMNSMTVDRNQTTRLVVKDMSVNPTIVGTYLQAVDVANYGNNKGGGFEVNTSLILQTNSVSSSYAVDSTTLDVVIFADSSSTPVTITLPAHRNGRKVIVKDSGGRASVNNISVSPSSGNIDDHAGSRAIANDWACLTLISNGTNWHIC